MRWRIPVNALTTPNRRRGGLIVVTMPSYHLRLLESKNLGRLKLTTTHVRTKDATLRHADIEIGRLQTLARKWRRQSRKASQAPTAPPRRRQVPGSRSVAEERYVFTNIYDGMKHSLNDYHPRLEP